MYMETNEIDQKQSESRSYGSPMLQLRADRSHVPGIVMIGLLNVFRKIVFQVILRYLSDNYGMKA